LRYSKVDFGEALYLRLVSLLNQKLKRLKQTLLLQQSVFVKRLKIQCTNVGLLQRSMLCRTSHIKLQCIKKPPEGG